MFVSLRIHSFVLEIDASFVVTVVGKTSVLFVSQRCHNAVKPTLFWLLLLVSLIRLNQIPTSLVCMSCNSVVVLSVVYFASYSFLRSADIDARFLL